MAYHVTILRFLFCALTNDLFWPTYYHATVHITLIDLLYYYLTYLRYLLPTYYYLVTIHVTLIVLGPSGPGEGGTSHGKARLLVGGS